VLWYGSAEYSKTQTKNESSRIEQRNPDGDLWASFPKVRFAMDSPLERDGFETSVPGERAYGLNFVCRLMSFLFRRSLLGLEGAHQIQMKWLALAGLPGPGRIGCGPGCRSAWQY
jgi:hypothetical protein